MISRANVNNNNKGTMTKDMIKNGLDLTYLRGQVVALYKLSSNIHKKINELESEIKDKEMDQK